MKKGNLLFYQDILFQDRLDNSIRNSQRDSINDQAIDYTLRKSISLIGVRKNKTGNILNINSQKHWKNEMKKLGGEYLLWSESPENPISN